MSETTPKAQRATDLPKLTKSNAGEKAKRKAMRSGKESMANTVRSNKTKSAEGKREAERLMNLGGAKSIANQNLRDKNRAALDAKKKRDAEIAENKTKAQKAREQNARVN